MNNRLDLTLISKPPKYSKVTNHRRYSSDDGLFRGFTTSNSTTTNWIGKEIDYGSCAVFNNVQSKILSSGLTFGVPRPEYFCRVRRSWKYMYIGTNSTLYKTQESASSLVSFYFVLVSSIL